MKISVKNQRGQYTLISIVPELVEVKGKFFNKTVTKAVVYCYDKDRKAHKFLADDIERYD